VRNKKTSTSVDENGKKKHAPKLETKIQKTSDEPDTANTAVTEPASAKKFREFSSAFAVPDSPAAHVLGVAPEKVIHAETPKQLVAALINGLDEKGNLQNGFAIDFAPMQVYLGKDRPAGKEMDAERYARGARGIFSSAGITEYFMRVLGRTQLSLATIRGSSEDDKSGKIAFGLHTTFIDAKDRAILTGVTRVPDPKPNSLSGPTLTELGQTPDSDPNDPAHAQFKNDPLGHMANFLWDHASWSIGAAPSWIADDAETRDYHWNGLTAWSTFTISSKPTGKFPQFDFLLHFRYRSDEQIPVADALPLRAGVVSSDPFVSQDSWVAAVGLRTGGKNLFVTGTATYTSLRQNQRGRDDTLLYSLALEAKIPSGPWLSLSVGTETGAKDEKQPLLVLAGVKLGLDGESFGKK
jgi:hypothetical protein